MVEVCEREHIRFWRASELEHLELQHARNVTASTARQVHEEFSIQLVERGVEGFSYRGAIYRAPAGAIALIHPGEVHTSFAAGEEPSTYRLLYPAAALMQQIASGLAEHEQAVPYFPEPVILAPHLFRRLKRLHLALERPRPRAEAEAALFGSLAQLILQYGQKRPTPGLHRCNRLIDEVRHHIEAHYARDITLAELGQLVHLSPFHLARAFQAQMGLPPHAYLIQVRIARAKALLARGHAIAEVAALTGFVDQSHLYKHFKQTVGVTPGQYVQSRRSPGRAAGAERR